MAAKRNSTKAASAPRKPAKGTSSKAAPITPEQREAVYLARLKHADERVESALCALSMVMERFDSCGNLACGVADGDSEDLRAAAVAISAIGRVGSEDAHDVRDDLEALDLLAEVSLEDVAVIEKAQAEAKTMAEMRRLSAQLKAQTEAAQEGRPHEQA